MVQHQIVDETPLRQGLAGVASQLLTGTITCERCAAKLCFGSIATAGVTAACFGADPLDIAKTLIQVADAKNQRGLAGTILHIIQERGFGGLFVGLGAEYVKSCVNTFVYFVIYAFAKRKAAAWQARAQDAHSCVSPMDDPKAQSDGEERLHVGLNFVCGMVAAACGQMVQNPLNVAHIQIQAGTSQCGFATTISNVFHAEGVRCGAR
eukprot:SAG31_NODE_228_length_19803_cov_29.496498_12_plen_208_part_00